MQLQLREHGQPGLCHTRHRMVRRLKPQEGTFQKPKAKSRWCVLGHQDPDAADMFTYAPTPQTQSIMMFLFLLQLCNLTLSIADLKNAFCQSDSLDRSADPLFVEPCEILDLPPGSLIQLIAPVYGLNDAPLRWHRTLTAWLIKQGYRKSLLEPCLYVHNAPGGSVDGLILIEVDDLAIGSHWMNSINSVHLCIRSVGLPRRVVLRLQDPRRFWHNI